MAIGNNPNAALHCRYPCRLLENEGDTSRKFFLIQQTSTIDQFWLLTRYLSDARAAPESPQHIPGVTDMATSIHLCVNCKCGYAPVAGQSYKCGEKINSIVAGRMDEIGQQGRGANEAGNYSRGCAAAHPPPKIGHPSRRHGIVEWRTQGGC